MPWSPACKSSCPAIASAWRGAIDSHHDRVRFAWELIGPNGGAPVYAGVDFGTLAADGRLSSVTGFIDRAPDAQQG